MIRNIRIGRMVFCAGLVGWNAQCKFETTDFAGQAAQTFRNIAAVLEAAGARPEHVRRMSWYVLDKEEYLQAGRQIDEAFRAVFGDHCPVTTVVEVAGLLARGSKLEIEATAVVPTD